MDTDPFHFITACVEAGLLVPLSCFSRELGLELVPEIQLVQSVAAALMWCQKIITKRNHFYSNTVF